MLAMIRLLVSLSIPDPVAFCAESADPMECQVEVCVISAIDYDVSECDGLVKEVR